MCKPLSFASRPKTGIGRGDLDKIIYGKTIDIRPFRVYDAEWGVHHGVEGQSNSKKYIYIQLCVYIYDPTLLEGRERMGITKQHSIISNLTLPFISFGSCFWRWDIVFLAFSGQDWFCKLSVIPNYRMQCTSLVWRVWCRWWCSEM